MNLESSLYSHACFWGINEEYLQVILIRLTRFNHLFCLSPLTKSILESTCESLHIPHSSCPNRAATLCLFSPIKIPHFLIGIRTWRTCFLLNVKRHLSTTTAGSVRLIMSLTEWSCTFRLSFKIVVKRRKELSECFWPSFYNWKDILV